METQILGGAITKTTRYANSPLPAVQPVTDAVQSSKDSRGRRWFFRMVRLGVSGTLAWAAVLLVQKHANVVSSDQAYLNGPITALRAPIGGVLSLEGWEPGAEIRAGATLFRVDNPRFGNAEAMSQLNWIQELMDRLRVEHAEAELRLAQETELFKYQQILFQDKIISQHVYLQEESKVGLCRITVNSKKDQLRAAELRGHEIEKHLALQKRAVTPMPFDGVVWSVRTQDGSEVSGHETVLHVLDAKRVWVDAFVPEKHTGKFQIGNPVMVRAVDGAELWTGRVASVRGGVGRLDPEQTVAVPAGDLLRRRVAVRIKLDSANPFTASQFFGVGRSVKVTPLGS